MAWVAPVAALMGSVGGIVSSLNQPKPPKPEAPPTPPTVESAEEIAKKNLDARRRKILMGGGDTDITGGMIILANSQRRTLLG